jgi:lipoprotein NlpI
MRNSLLHQFTGVCIGVLVAAGLCGELKIISVARADATDIARDALLAKARQQCAVAIGLFDQALKQGQFSLKEEGLLIFSRGVCFENLGVRQKALADFNSAIALVPDFANAYNYRGIVWGDLHEYDRAIADFEQASRLKPNDPLVFNNLGNAFAAKDELAKAIANYNRAIEIRRDYAEAYYNRASTYVTLHDELHALADYDEAIRLQPTYGGAYTNRGVLKLTRGEIRQAISDFDSAVRLNQRDLRALMNRAHAYLVADRPRDAVSDFSSVIEAEPGNAAAYLGRGRAALFSVGKSQSIDDFLTANRLLPTSAYTVLWLHIARTHLGENDTEEFKENSKKIRRDAWPGVLLDIYDGDASPEKARKTAAAGSPQERNQRLCEVDFFVGEYAAYHRPSHEARELLQAALSECQPHEPSYVAAKAELSLLDP